jgi:hypothetical protein
MSRRPNDLIGLPNPFEETAMPYPAYPEGLVGKYLDYEIDQGRTMATGLPRDSDRLLRNQTIAETVNVYSGQPTGSNGITMVQDGPAWTFTYLRYVSGGVTIARLPGPILTGPMSGCLLCKYTHNGQQSVAHVGTGDTPQSPETIAVKSDWEEFIGRLPASNALSVMGFNPLSFFTPEEIAAQQLGGKLGGVPQVMGYFGGGLAYAMLLAPLPANQNTLSRKMLKVASIVLVKTLRPWSELANSGSGLRWSAIKSAILCST